MAWDFYFYIKNAQTDRRQRRWWAVYIESIILKKRWIYIPWFIGSFNRMKSSYYTLYRGGESISRLPRSPWDDRKV